MIPKSKMRNYDIPMILWRKVSFASLSILFDLKERVLVRVLKWRSNKDWAVLLNESVSHLVFRDDRGSQNITCMSLSYKMEEWLDSLVRLCCDGSVDVDTEVVWRPVRCSNSWANVWSEGLEYTRTTSGGRGDFSGTIGRGGIKVFNPFGHVSRSYETQMALL